MSRENLFKAVWLLEDNNLLRGEEVLKIEEKIKKLKSCKGVIKR